MPEEHEICSESSRNRRTIQPSFYLSGSLSSFQHIRLSVALTSCRPRSTQRLAQKSRMPASTGVTLVRFYKCCNRISCRDCHTGRESASLARGASFSLLGEIFAASLPID